MEIVIGIIILIFIIVLIQYNTLIKKRKIVEQELATIDVYLTQRFELIPNLADCVKKYSIYEEKMFTNLTEMRTSYLNGKDLTTGRLTDVELNKLIATFENHPDLKANEQFLNLQKKLASVKKQVFHTSSLLLGWIYFGIN